VYASHENVKRAIDTLQGRGQKITVRAVREEIGGGSLEDIGELIGRVLMGDPVANGPLALPALPYDLLPLDEAVIQRHLAEMEGEAHARAFIEHLEQLVNSARAVQVVGEPAMNWVFRAMTQLGERSGVNMVISALGEDLRRVSDTAAEMLRRMRREYARVRGDQQEGGPDDGRTAADDRARVEASDAEPA
jgi:DNA-binding protein